MRHNTPDSQAVVFLDADGFKIGIFGHEPHAGEVDSDSFHGELAVEVANGYFVVGRFQTFINDEQVAVGDTSSGHRIPLCPGIKGSAGVADKVPVEVDSKIDEVGSRRWKSRLNTFEGVQCELGIGLGRIDIEVPGAMQVKSRHMVYIVQGQNYNKNGNAGCFTFLFRTFLAVGAYSSLAQQCDHWVAPALQYVPICP